jgi:hypothetical protein
MPRVTKIIPIKDAYIISTNVADSTEQSHAMDVVYGLGDLVKTDTIDQHRIWRSVHGITGAYPSGNLGFSPLAELDIDSPVHWSLVSATNRYKVFDNEQSSKAVNSGSMQYVLGNGLGRFNLVSVLGIEGALSVTCRVVDVNNTEIFNETKILTSNAGINNFWRFLFWPRNFRKSVVFTGITPLVGSTITLTVNGNGDNEVKCGLIVVGNSISFDDSVTENTVDYGASTSVRDFSIREELPTGDYRFRRGPNTRDGKFTFLIPNELYDLWNETVESIGPEPFLFTATDIYDSTNIFGIFGKADANLDHVKHSRVTVEIKGLI